VPNGQFVHSILSTSHLPALPKSLHEIEEQREVGVEMDFAACLQLIPIANYFLLDVLLLP